MPEVEYKSAPKPDAKAFSKGKVRPATTHNPNADFDNFLEDFITRLIFRLIKLIAIFRQA